MPPAVRRGRPRLCAAAAALLLAQPRRAHPSTRGWAPYSLSAQRAGARTAALTSGSGSRPTAAPTHTEQHAQDSHRTLPLTPLTATGYSDLITGTSLSTPCTRLPVAVASAASCPDLKHLRRGGGDERPTVAVRARGGRRLTDRAEAVALLESGGGGEAGKPPADPQKDAVARSRAGGGDGEGEARGARRCWRRRWRGRRRSRNGGERVTASKTPARAARSPF